MHTARTSSPPATEPPTTAAVLTEELDDSPADMISSELVMVFMDGLGVSTTGVMPSKGLGWRVISTVFGEGLGGSVVATMDEGEGVGEVVTPVFAHSTTGFNADASGIR